MGSVITLWKQRKRFGVTEDSEDFWHMWPGLLLISLSRQKFFLKRIFTLYATLKSLLKLYFCSKICGFKTNEIRINKWKCYGQVLKNVKCFPFYTIYFSDQHLTIAVFCLYTINAFSPFRGKWKIKTYFWNWLGNNCYICRTVIRQRLFMTSSTAEGKQKKIFGYQEKKLCC